MFEVVAPIQSYLRYVARGLDMLTSHVSVARFLSSEQSFGNAVLTDVYSPWDSVGHFGRVKIRQASVPIGSNQNAVRDSNVPEGTTSLKPFAVPKPNKRRSHLLFEDELTESATRLIAGSSKD